MHLLFKERERNNFQLSGSRISETKTPKERKIGNYSGQVPTANHYGSGDPDRSPVCTTTQEPFMPARLYFKLFRKKNLLKALGRLNCIDWGEDDDHFTLSYCEEAKSMGLDVPCHKVPEGLFPVILAIGQIVDDSDLYLDVRSFKRAIGVIKFLYKHIGPEFLRVTHVATYNRYIGVTADTIRFLANFDFDGLFLTKNIQSELVLDQIVFKEGDKAYSTGMLGEGNLGNPIPAIQKISVTDISELDKLESVLMMNMRMAQKSWGGKAFPLQT